MGEKRDMFRLSTRVLLVSGAKGRRIGLSHTKGWDIYLRGAGHKKKERRNQKIPDKISPSFLFCLPFFQGDLYRVACSFVCLNIAAV